MRTNSKISGLGQSNMSWEEKTTSRLKSPKIIAKYLWIFKNMRPFSK